MPFTATCPDHPEAAVLYPGDLIMHATVDHPGVPLEDVSAKCVVTYVPQVVAHGNPVRRVFRCRYCAAQVDTTDPDRPPYCDSHLDRANA